MSKATFKYKDGQLTAAAVMFTALGGGHYAKIYDEAGECVYTTNPKTKMYEDARVEAEGWWALQVREYKSQHPDLHASWLEWEDD